ncbi:phenylacetate--CoA ligase family protein [bacterium]|nr:phenylacetate--CoA ligase family protein [bacterium]
MRLYNFLTKNVILPLSDKKTKWNIAKHLKFLNESQWWSLDQLIDYQNRKLKELINHVYNNVPYYRSIMDKRYLTPDDFKTIGDLKKLPILTKTDVQNNFPDLICAKNINHSKSMKGHSSGSTGVPIHYYLSRDAYGMNKAAYLRGWSWMGFQLGDRLIKVSQNKRSSFIKRLQDKVDNTYLFSHSYTKENLDEFVTIMHKFKPKFLRSYPDPLEFLAKHIKKYNIKIPPIKAINTTGNMLIKETRDLIEEVFNAPVFDSYSCEGGANVFECPTHSCYHTSMEYAITEIINENGKEVEPGESGRYYTTDLWNYATPLIRYDSGDIVTKGKSKCHCGRNLMTISKIQGRDNDIVITPDGNYLVAQSFTTYFKYIPEITQFQVHQIEKDEILFKLVVREDFKKEQKIIIINDWFIRLKKTTKIKTEIVKEIPLLKSGKRRFVFRNMEIEV